MTSSVLDKPYWHSLNTYHADFAIGTGLAKRYPADIMSITAIPDQSEAALRDLAQIVAQGEVVLIDGVPQSSDLPGWTMGASIDVYQMLYDQPIHVPEGDQTILELGAADVPDILRLIDLTHPGPFQPRALELGRFIGLRHQGQLIAIAGERSHLPGYHEISTVCTHPAYQGRGYARLLVSEMMTEHRRQGETSFLHVFTGNTTAFKFYQNMGFRTRTVRHLAMWQH
ncbi:MAG: GNAT family N-acetyltransferase [Chloroflexi bacterium]|nr:GNAT family N-acetyltransferase [Chloroflexota bacterium]